MDELVWVGAGRGDEPAWTVGGSYAVVRSSACSSSAGTGPPSSEQEGIIGRTKRTGAPMGQGREEDIPAFDATPTARQIAAVRPHPARQPADRGDGAQPHPAPRLLVQPRLRRRRPARPGPAVHRLPARPRGGLRGRPRQRLDGEALEEYIRPVGGGYFFTLPGVSGETRYLGRALLEG